MKKIIGLILALLLSMNTVFAQTGEPSSWAKSEVDTLKAYHQFDSSIFKDYSSNITRGQFIYLAVRVYELFDGKEIIPDPSISFSDTESIYAIKGATVGITKGIGNNLFGFNQLVTREQLTTMMVSLLKQGKIKMKEPSKALFADDHQMSSWAKDNVYIAYSNSVISGVGDNKFAPQGHATIEQAMIITSKLIKTNMGKIWTSPKSTRTYPIAIPTTTAASAVDIKQLKIGDYVQFGIYHEDPIVWRVINFDENGDPLLWSENILEYFCFDASESGKGLITNAGRNLINGGPVAPYEDIEANGSNLWRNSNLREWLQSRDKNVNYTTQAPIGDAIGYYYDKNIGFESKPGFLNAFSSEDISLIKPVKNKTTISSYFLSHADGGTEPKVYDFSELPTFTTNEESAYYDITEDLVFILTTSEIIKYVINNNMDFQKHYLDQAINYPELAPIKDFLIGHNKSLLFRSLRPFDSYSDAIINEFVADKHVYLYHEYFTRTLIDDSNAAIAFVGRVHPITGQVGTFLNGSITPHDPNGIVPAIYIKHQHTKILEGNGSHPSPYVITYQ